MSSIWYEYLEETGGEVIPTNYFKHVSRSLTKCNENEFLPNNFDSEIFLSYNYESDFWWPVHVIDKLSEGWIKLEFYGVKNEIDNCSLWYDMKSSKQSVQSIKWCIDNEKSFISPANCFESDIQMIIEKNKLTSDIKLEFITKKTESYRLIKVGAYLECWLENSVGFVWPVKVLSNFGGRLKLIWFGCDSTGKPNTNNAAFYLFYLDYRLHSLGWAKSNGWKYSPPLNIGINISISNVDTFVRGSPSAFPMELSCDREIKEHFFEEGWQIEAVNPIDPSKICPATIRYVLDKSYFLVELTRQGTGGDAAVTTGATGDPEPVMFAGFGGMAEILPANTSKVSGYSIVGLRNNSWDAHLLSSSPQKYAPHLGYFQNGGGIDCSQESVFLPGCKLEAVNPWNKQSIHAATLIRSMEGSRLVWIRLDSEPDLPDFLVDPLTSTEIFPVGWCEMVDYPIVLPSAYLMPAPVLAPFDPDDITIFLHPACYLGPYLSRTAAAELLPRFIGPGHCLPVLRELFHLLLKVSHKPYKLMRLLQIDNEEDRHELMATITVPSPKSEWGNRNKRSDWLVEVAIRKRAILGFCRQTALSLGSCPSFITTSAVRVCNLGCEARMAARAGEKMSHQRRKRLFSRPLMALGISYRELKSRVVGAASNSSSNSEIESSDREDQNNNNNAVESRMCTRGMRLVVSDSRTRSTKRRSVKFFKPPKGEVVKMEEEEQLMGTDGIRREGRGRDMVPQSVINVKDFVIDPTFLAGDIERVTLSSNPLLWTVEQLTDYLSNTDCRQLTTWLANEKVDGRAFLLLTLPVLSTLCGLQLEVAIRLCRHVVSLKRVFVEKFADMQELLLPDDI